MLGEMLFGDFALGDGGYPNDTEWADKVKDDADWVDKIKVVNP